MPRLTWPGEIRRLETKLEYLHAPYWVRRKHDGKPRRPRHPQMDLDGLMIAVLKSEVMARFTPRAEIAYEYMLWCNSELAASRAPATDGPPCCFSLRNKAHASDACVKKRAKLSASGKELYLWKMPDHGWANDAECMDRFLLEFNSSEPAKKQRGRVNIPQAVRYAVWNMHIGKAHGLGKCFCCHGEVSQQEFECGHVLAVAHGGTNDVSNLRVLCRACNRSMGDQHMMVFMANHFPDNSE